MDKLEVQLNKEWGKAVLAIACKGERILALLNDPIYRSRLLKSLNKTILEDGAGLKASFSGVVFYHWATGGIPAMWIPFAWIDVAFLVIFMLAWGKVENIYRTVQ